MDPMTMKLMASALRNKQEYEPIGKPLNRGLENSYGTEEPAVDEKPDNRIRQGVDFVLQHRGY